MEIEGFVIHHTACVEKQQNYDFIIHADGSVTASSISVQPGQIHICLEGDFNIGYAAMSLDQKTQLFIASKMIMELSRLHDISPLYLFPHTDDCPGSYFPWNSLVIYPVDGYH